MRAPRGERSGVPTTSRRTFIARAAGGLAGCAFLPRGVRAAEFQWKYGIDLGPDDPIVSNAVAAFEKIRTETNGRLDVKVFPSSELGGTSAMLAQLRSGALEALGFTGTNLDAIVPVAGITSVGFAFKDAAAACAAFDGELGDLVRREIIAKGVRPVGRVFSPGFLQLMMVARPVRVPDDLAGLKIRVGPSKNNIALMTLLGGSPVALSTNEVFLSLTTHLIDGVSTSVSALASIGWTPAIKDISLTNHQWLCLWTLFNEEKWQSLSPSLQAIVTKHMNEAVAAQRRETPVREASLLDKLQRSGIAVNATDAAVFRAKLKASGYYARMKDEFGAPAWAALARYADVT